MLLNATKTSARSYEDANSRKRVTVVCCNSGFDLRAELVSAWFEAKGYDSQLIVSSWDHQGKRPKREFGDRIQLRVRPYRKNISVARVLSCHDFCTRAAKVVQQLCPEVVYAIIPSNQLAYEFDRYKRAHSNCAVIYDVCDMWPEAFPLDALSSTPVYRLWRDMRNRALVRGDMVLAECQMFADKLNSQIGDSPISVVHYARSDSGIDVTCDLSSSKYRLCYLGSINNIIDIDEIVRLAKSLPRKVVVEVIGDGENRQAMLDALKKAGVEAMYHGRVYDDSFKHEVMQRCHFGLNIMKPGVAVGLTTKSIDYFEAGLPILNNIRGDTWELVRERKIGVNVPGGAVPNNESLSKVASNRKEARLVYEELFSEDAFARSLDAIVGRMLV